MIDFIYDNLLPKAVEGVHLLIIVKVKVKGVHLNIYRDVRISFSGQSLGRTSIRCGCGTFVTSKALVLVFNQPDLRES